MRDLPGRLAQLAALNQQGLLPSAAYDAAVEREMAAWTDQQRVSTGVPEGLPSTFSGVAAATGPILTAASSHNGQLVPQQQPQLAAPRVQLQLPAGPSPAALAANIACTSSHTESASPFFCA